MNLDIGSHIGDYEIVGILGSGGMGKVYKVRNLISDRIEAMKVLLPDLANAPDLADRFLREIKVHAGLEHPNIAALHTAVRVENQLLMLMECVEGVTLDEKLKAGPLPVPQAVDYIRQVLSALEYAHSRGVIHRDIKPTNMMLTPSGVVKLMDFGIAKGPDDRKLTMTGTTLGSLYYMSPEQIQAPTMLDARSDLYSVGISLYELVTGKLPFEGDSQFAILSAHMQKIPVAPITIVPSVPPELSDLILMSVAKDPAARFQTAGAFRNALGLVVPAAASVAAPVVAPVASPLAQAAPVAIPTATMAQAAPPAAQPSPQNFQLIQPTQAPPSAARSHRGLWMGLGALAMAGAVIALIQLAPWKGSKAAPQQPAAQQTTTPAPAGQSTPPAPAPADATAPPVTPSATPAAQANAPAPTQAAPATAVSKPAPTASRPAPAPAQQHPSYQQASQPAPQPPAQSAPQPEPPPARPAAPAVDMAQVAEAREQFAQLSARATGCHASLQTLRNSLSRQGLNLRGDIQTAATMMDTYMRSANDALNANDLAQSKTLMEKAERQLEILEKFLNR